MEYEFHPAGSNVFAYGGAGNKFYMIVQGTAGVWAPFDFAKQMRTAFTVMVES